jgi:hypothetical protein
LLQLGIVNIGEDSTLHQSSGSEVLNVAPEDRFRKSQLLREALLAEELSGVVVCIDQYLCDTLLLGMSFECVHQFAPKSLMLIAIKTAEYLTSF